MELQRTKAGLVIMAVIVFISGITFFVTSNYYTPKIRADVNKKLNAEQKMQKVLVAKTDIPMGAVIKDENLTVEDVPMKNIIDVNKVFVVKSTKTAAAEQVVGKMAKTNIYANEQIHIDKLADKVDDSKLGSIGKPEPQKIEESDRYITVDIPNYNFVNGRVDKGSLVDILVDKGNGKYDVVLSKVVIYDKKVVGDTSDGKSKSNEDIQPKKPSAKVATQSSNTGDQLPGSGNTTPLQDKNNPVFQSTDDYRVTLMVNELEYRRLFEAMTYGKLLTREYVLPTQEASKVTFDSAEEKKITGDVTIKENKPAGQTQTQTQNQTQTQTQTQNQNNTGLPGGTQ